MKTNRWWALFLTYILHTLACEVSVFTLWSVAGLQQFLQFHYSSRNHQEYLNPVPHSVRHLFRKGGGGAQNCAHSVRVCAMENVCFQTLCI